MTLSLDRRHNVLILGSGAREHALSWALERSPLIENLYVAPGNAGTAPRNIEVNLESPELIRALCQEREIDLVIVGSEEMLARGITDYLNKFGIDVFGPSSRGALIESDKAYARKICEEIGIPSPLTKVFNSFDNAKNYIQSAGFDLVVKDSFLCGGKGVLVDHNRGKLIDFTRAIFDKNKPAQTVVIEEMLSGPEISAFVLCDGNNITYLGDAQDYKRIGDGNVGDNTGGMGAISPAPAMTNELRKIIMNKFAAPLVSYLNSNGVTYKGVIFLGLMLTKESLKLLEFNARFGDPETQALIPRLDCDLMELFIATVNGTLGDYKVRLSKDASVCVVMASRGYPGKYKKGTVVTIPYNSQALVFHANTRRMDDASILAMGGRTISVVALGSNIQQARAIAYKSIGQVAWDEGYNRTDIGALELV